MLHNKFMAMIKWLKNKRRKWKEKEEHERRKILQKLETESLVWWEKHERYKEVWYRPTDHPTWYKEQERQGEIKRLRE